MIKILKNQRFVIFFCVCVSVCWGRSLQNKPDEQQTQRNGSVDVAPHHPKPSKPKPTQNKENKK